MGGLRDESLSVRPFIPFRGLSSRFREPAFAWSPGGRFSLAASQQAALKVRERAVEATRIHVVAHCGAKLATRDALLAGGEDTGEQPVGQWVTSLASEHVRCG